MLRRGAPSFRERLERIAFSPLTRTNRGYYLFVGFLLAVLLWGLYAYVVQVYFGLVSTGMRDMVIWGLYIVNFVFFLGIAMAGTVISAVLRVTHAAWRTPITRMAEVVTVSALMVGGVMPIIDLGRPDRVWHIFVYGRYQSAIMWDVVVITTYLMGSLIYLYLPLIPDFALMRDRLGRGASALKQRVYSFLALGWRNTPEQRHRLERGMNIMAVAIIPMAVLTHTVASFIFSWMLRPGWDSTIYGIYFVIGAIFSGIASIIIIMTVFRWLFHLEEYITARHFRNLSLLLLTMLAFYVYLVMTEYLTVGYKLEGEEKHLLELLILGRDAPWFWLFIVAGFILPAFLIVFKRLPLIPRIVVASVLVNVSMWIKRFVIVVPTLKVPLMPLEFGNYTPTWVEWSITAAALAGFVLVFAIIAKLVPIVSVWEMAEENDLETG
ncbi:MAG: NrfD/PsrC family molybdoenzyme membrane anchor subunit, partial [Chloroflexota bacterium]